MNTPIDIHRQMVAWGVRQATLVFDDEAYEYLDLGGNEFQFGAVGDIPTNYKVEYGQPILVSGSELRPSTCTGKNSPTTGMAASI